MIITNNHENNDNSCIQHCIFIPIALIKVATENVKINQIVFDRLQSSRRRYHRDSIAITW